MENAQKNKVYGYLFKVVLSLISLFCLYNVVSILFLSPYSGKKLQSRISSTVNAIEYNIKRAGLENTEKVINKSNLINRVNGSAWAKKIERTSIFAGSVDVNIEKAEEEFVIYEQVEVTADTEIIFKGLADDLAYINIRRAMDGKSWHDSREIAAALGKLAGDIPEWRESMMKFWVVLGNLGICSMCGVVSWQGYKQGAPEMILLGGVFIFIGLWAIFDTITGR